MHNVQGDITSVTTNSSCATDTNDRWTIPIQQGTHFISRGVSSASASLDPLMSFYQDVPNSTSVFKFLKKNWLL